MLKPAIMSDALRTPITIEAFLTWEAHQEQRWEFDGFAPVAMTGGSYEHEKIGNNLRSALTSALRGKRCEVLGPTIKIEAAGRIRYPDAFVFCSPATRGQSVFTDPVVVFGVLSPSTSRIDRLDKLLEYQATSSIRRYVILEQDTAAATVYLKTNDVWTVSILTGDATLAMPEIEADIPLSAVYEGIDLPASDTEQH
jgi:Uma2 family endonuclease